MGHGPQKISERFPLATKVLHRENSLASLRWSPDPRALTPKHLRRVPVLDGVCAGGF
jgi:hypothetical protein